jgi:hypothetical protein
VANANQEQKLSGRSIAAASRGMQRRWCGIYSPGRLTVSGCHSFEIYILTLLSSLSFFGVKMTVPPRAMSKPHVIGKDLVGLDGVEPATGTIMARPKDQLAQNSR